jgi:NAD(P)-dependent dehydrogenase (short-subunit alcohol dehydrogenase family)
MPSALITGANRGLGLEFARQYLGDGWQVYAACRDPASASELRRLAGNNDKLRIMAMDVTDPASIQAAATELDGQAIDLLLNNAGGLERGQAIGNIDYDAWAEVLAVNTMAMRVSEGSSSMWHAAIASSLSLSPAAWDRLPTTALGVRSFIAARKRQ